MVHPHTELRHVNNAIGDGVFATKPIPKGTLVYVKDPLEIDLSDAAFRALPHAIRQIADKYSYIDERGHRILSWDIAKFVNHSCEPNTISSGYGFEIAIRDIDAGEEITDEYGLFNLEWSIECHCGSGTCRGAIRGDDIDELYPKWDEWVIESLRSFNDVDQPLRPYLAESKAKALDKYLKTGKGYRSVYDLKHAVHRSAAVNS